MLTDTELKVFEKGLDFAPLQKKINKLELRMRLKWHFWVKSESFSEVTGSKPKSKWQPPQGYLCLEVYLNKVENELFELPKANIKNSNLWWGEGML